MRVHFSTSWIFQGWIVCLIFGLFEQSEQAKPPCNQHQYIKGNKCCDKCQPGTYLFILCTESKPTTCRPCGTDEYQAEYTTKTKCQPQKFCDDGKGFYRDRPSSRTQPEPCQCKQGFQCSPMNCEFCERIPSCIAGEGLMGEPGKQSCKECDPGFFSDSNSSEPCKKWTDCKAIGKTEEKAGSVRNDVECGPPVGPSSSWVVVTVPCVVILVFAAILSCCKDKLSLFSVNLQTCVQNIKRSRIQQETLTPPYHSTGLQNSPLYEITSHLIRQDHNPPEYLRMCSETNLTMCDASGPVLSRSLEQDQGSAGSGRDRASDGSASSSSGDRSEGCPCSCLPSMKEPVEVGDNEDCSQLVAVGLARACSCGQGETLEDSCGQGETLAVTAEPAGAVNHGEPLLCGSCCSDPLPSGLQGSQELYLDYSSPPGREGASEVLGLRCSSRQNEPCCCSIDSTTIPSTSTPAMSNNGGLLLSDGTASNLLEPDAHLEVLSQHPESALTCGQETENDITTTFVSNGQVMNFTGDVIMVYVSQTSLNSGNRSEDPCGCPVQEGSGEGRCQPVPPAQGGQIPYPTTRGR